MRGWRCREPPVPGGSCAPNPAPEGAQHPRAPQLPAPGTAGTLSTSYTSPRSGVLTQQPPPPPAVTEPWPGVLGTGRTCHEASEAGICHFHAELSIPPRAIPVTSHSLIPTPIWDTAERPGTRHCLLPQAEPAWCWCWGGSGSLRPTRTSRCPCGSQKSSPCLHHRGALSTDRLMEGDARELGGPEACGTSPSRWIHTIP